MIAPSSPRCCTTGSATWSSSDGAPGPLSAGRVARLRIRGEEGKTRYLLAVPRVLRLTRAYSEAFGHAGEEETRFSAHEEESHYGIRESLVPRVDLPERA